MFIILAILSLEKLIQKRGKVQEIMYRINEIKVSLEQDKAKNFVNLLADFFGVKNSDIVKFKIQKRALDARKKSDIHYKYNFDVEFTNTVECEIVNKFNLKKIEKIQTFNQKVNNSKTVVVVGSGPAGLFASYELAKAGVKVVLLERGEPIDDRVNTVEKLLESGVLNTESNIQFGEGGAGTFSDGKLNTGINSPLVGEVLKTFYMCGAEENILYDSKPHIGTDQLRDVVKNLRNQIIQNQGTVLFNSKFTTFKIEKDKIIVCYEKNNEELKIVADDLVLALGYSARDTLRSLFSQGINFEQKAFSVGYRIEHLQELINVSQYGENYNKLLPAAEYKLFSHLTNGRTVYTFCMCPGGEVVPAINNNGEIVTNGMSYHSRSGRNANSAILVNVNPEDFGDIHPLAGIDFQERLERNAYNKTKGCFVVSRVGDFLNNRLTTYLGVVKPTIRPKFVLGNVSELLPKEFAESIKLGIKDFAKKLKGFDCEDALLTGIETRSSAPFMIKRGMNLSTNFENVYAIGEGAGMAGGIVSSAVDGIKIARKIIEKY